MKLKTVQSIAKRFKVTKTKKVIQRTAGQNHFNARESGNTTRKKRSDHIIYKKFASTVKQFIN